MSNKNIPILYSFRRCPYAMRGRMGLMASGSAVEIREIVLRDKPAHMVEISSKATVPVLQLADGTVIDESLDIMIWALGRQDPDEFLDADNDTADILIAQNDGSFKRALDRYKYPGRYPGEDCSGAREDGLAILKDWNARIEKDKALNGQYKSLADIAIFPFVRQFAHVDRDWFYAQDLKPLQNWLKQHLESDLFTSIMEKYTPWQLDDDPIIFGA